MRKLAIVLIVLALTFPVVAQTSADDRDVLMQRSSSWMDAVARKDRATIEKLLAPDFELDGIGDVRPPVPRDEWIGNALRLDWKNGGYDAAKVDVYGDVAVVTSSYSFSVDPGEWKPTISATVPAVDVWVRQDGQWRVHRRHLADGDMSRWRDRIAGFLAAMLLFGFFSIARRIARPTRRPAA